MAKKRAEIGQRTFDSFGTVKAIPHGYYSGDKPNPNLRGFVERKCTPYDPENDDYDIPAFNQPIETTKATAIYNMHVYWSKKPAPGHPAVYPPLHEARRPRARPILWLGRNRRFGTV